MKKSQILIKKYQPEAIVIIGNSVGGSIPEVLFQTTKVDVVVYGEAEVTIKLAKKKYTFFEVPISYYGRTYEEGKKIGFKDGIRAVYVILKYFIFTRK